MATLNIQQKIEDMIDYAAPIIQRWPKLHRYTLGERILNQMYAIAELCEAANRKQHKYTTMQDMDVKLAVLQQMVRRANRIRYQNREHSAQLLDNHKYEVYSGMIIEIGRMLGGWMKAVNARRKDTPA